MAKKTLHERLAEAPLRSDVQESTKRFATFLKYWAEVKKAFKDGWSYKDIWYILSRDGDIDFSYSSFLNFIRKVKRRQLDHEKERTRRAAVATAVNSTDKAPTIKPGSTKIEMPLFGQEVKPRNPKRF